MTSLTNIDLNLSEVNCAVVVYAKQNDRLSRHIAATLYDGASSWTPPAGSYPIIRFLKPDGTSGFYDVDEDGNAATTISGNVATMTIVEQALTVPGDVYMELNFYNAAGEKLTTLKWLLRVQQSVLEDSTIVSSDYYNVLSAQIAAVLGVTAHPPYIDSTTKNWMIWDVDANAYVDSGYSSIGLTGPYFTPAVDSSGNISWTNNGGLPNPATQNIKGPQGIQGPTGTAATIQVGTTSTGAAGTDADVTNSGSSSAAVFNFTIPKGDKGDQGNTGPQGVSITSTSKASGTGAPGTTDVYDVNLSNGTVAGQFNVYNGSDGAGSPGTQLPLMDGTATVGTAVAYAHEDHIHPSDTAKVSKTGDTMTGNLAMSEALINFNTDLSVSAPNSDEYKQAFFINDASNNWIGYVEAQHSTSGNRGIDLTAYREVNSSPVYNGMQLLIDGNGNPNVNLTAPSAWRSALNAVNKAGDTMTGSLELNSPNITSTSTSTAYGTTHLNVNDASGVNLGYFQPVTNSSGAGVQFTAARTGGYYHGVTLTIDSNGIGTVYFNQPDAWLYGLGLIYAANDTVTISDLAAAGYVTSSTANIYIEVVVPKSMKNISTVTVTAMTGALRGGSGAIDSTGNSTNLLSKYTITAEKSSDNLVRVHIVNSGAFGNVTNNTPVSFGGSITLKFT